MKDTLKLISKLAKKAGAIQLKYFGKAHEIGYKSEIDLVTEVDKKCEEFLVGEISKHFPGDDIVAEEGGGARTSSKRRWHIDPLDGTVNYAHSFPFFAVSIGLESDGDVVAGVIYDPNRDELFSARKAGGATCNGRPIKVSQSSLLKKSLLATGFACLAYPTKDRADNLVQFGHFIKTARAVRRPGSAATDLAWVACGRIDGFWERALKTWDMAAGVILIREAGGVVSSYDGGNFDLYGDEILVSNGLIHKEMVDILFPLSQALSREGRG